MYYQHIIDITKDYLGPAAKRFVDRQIDVHLHKSPDKLIKDDISTLAIRIRSGLVVLTQDTKLVEEAFQRITAISDLEIKPILLETKPII
jgi:hypothetical protein